MNSKDDFPWKENELLKEAYKQDNYLVSETGSETGQAVIFFSSNGIYYPNDEETFRAYIQKGNDAFEWFHLAQHREIQSHFEKIIFVRDVYKQWYVTGINERLDSVDKVLAFLRAQTDGYCITTCGGSAGGYAAALFGCLLHADRIFANSAQFLLLPDSRFGPFIERYASDPPRSRYYDLLPLLREQPNVFYTFPAQCEDDKTQYEHIRELPNIHILRIRSKIHGDTLEGICWPYLLTMDNDRRTDLYRRYSEKPVYRLTASNAILPTGEKVRLLCHKIAKKLRKLFCALHRRGTRHKGTHS